MTPPADAKIKAAIDETVGPRIADHRRYLVNATSDPFYVERAELLYVWDQYRNQYLDFAAAAHPAGHANPRVRAAVTEQMNYYGPTGGAGEHIARWPTDYAKMLSESFGRTDDEPLQVLYCDGPDDAREIALSIGLHHSADKYCTFLELVSPRGEPVNPHTAQLEADQIKRSAAPIVIDETMTGFGRLGRMWGQQRYEIDADITVVAGPAGGGLPFGAVVAQGSYFEGETFSSEHSGNPIICAAGAATMAEINAGVLEHVDDAAAALHEALEAVVVQFPDVLESTHHAGLLQSLTVRSGKVANRLVRGARDNGLLLRAPSLFTPEVIWLTPPLIISENEARRGVDMIVAATLDLADQL